MSAKKKSVRKDFRDAVFKRDGFSCKCCGYKPIKTAVIEDHLDAHHICDRTNMPNGGYVAANGVSLCKVGENCHLKAEKRESGYEPEVLYAKIGSSYEKAIEESRKLE